MVNRFELLIEEYQLIQERVNRLKVMPSPSNSLVRELGSLAIRLKKIKWQINHFGQRNKIAKVIARYQANEFEEQVIEVYLTGIEPFEALSFVRFKLSEYTIQEINAHEIPIGKPIK